MTEDFEVHAVGTARELARLRRDCEDLREAIRMAAQMGESLASELWSRFSASRNVAQGCELAAKNVSGTPP